MMASPSAGLLYLRAAGSGVNRQITGSLVLRSVQQGQLPRMLKNISPLISPSLLKILAEMGHGDEIVFSDAHFPGHTFNHTVLRADGLNADALLGAVIPLFELDAYATPVIMMAPVPGDSLDPAVEARYRKALDYDGEIKQMERYAFYERAKKAYAVVITGETAKYGNIILKKGVTPAV